MGDVGAKKFNLRHAEFHVLLFQLFVSRIAQLMLREKLLLNLALLMVRLQCLNSRLQLVRIINITVS